MPASWITERPSTHRRPPPAERPQLQLPLHQPAFEQAQPRRKREPQPAPRGAVLVDFYI